jgi:hypothetical protein
LLYTVSLVFWFVSGDDSDGSDGGCGDVCSGGDGYCGDDDSSEQMRDLQQADQLRKALLMLL